MPLQLFYCLCCPTSPREYYEVTERCHNKQFAAKDIAELGQNNQKAFGNVILQILVEI